MIVPVPVMQPWRMPVKFTGSVSQQNIPKRESCAYIQMQFLWCTVYMVYSIGWVDCFLEHYAGTVKLHFEIVWFYLLCRFNSLPFGRFEWNLGNFQADFSDWCLRYLLWNEYPQVNAIKSHWWLVSIGLGNGLLPDATNPLPEPMLTKFYDAIWRLLTTRRLSTC